MEREKKGKVKKKGRRKREKKEKREEEGNKREKENKTNKSMNHLHLAYIRRNCKIFFPLSISYVF